MQDNAGCSQIVHSIFATIPLGAMLGALLGTCSWCLVGVLVCGALLGCLFMVPCFGTCS